MMKLNWGNFASRRLSFAGPSAFSAPADDDDDDDGCHRQSSHVPAVSLVSFCFWAGLSPRPAPAAIFYMYTNMHIYSALFGS